MADPRSLSRKTLSHYRILEAAAEGILAAIGEKEQVVEWLEKAGEEKLGLLIVLGMERILRPAAFRATLPSAAAQT